MAEERTGIMGWDGEGNIRTVVAGAAGDEDGFPFRGWVDAIDGLGDGEAS